MATLAYLLWLFLALDNLSKCFLWGRSCTKLFTYILYLIFIMNSYHLYPHFTNEKTETQKKSLKITQLGRAGIQILFCSKPISSALTDPLVLRAHYKCRPHFYVHWCFPCVFSTVGHSSYSDCSLGFESWPISWSSQLGMWSLSASARAAITKFNRVGGFNNRYLYLTVLEAGKSNIKVLAW